MERIAPGLDCARKSGDRAAEARLHAYRGYLLRERGEQAAAEGALNQAIGIGEEIGDRWLVTKSLNTLGGVYAEQGRLAAGREHFEVSEWTDGASEKCSRIIA